MPLWWAQDTRSLDPRPATRALCPTAPPASPEHRGMLCWRPTWAGPPTDQGLTKSGDSGCRQQVRPKDTTLTSYFWRFSPILELVGLQLVQGVPELLGLVPGGQPLVAAGGSTQPRRVRALPPIPAGPHLKLVLTEMVDVEGFLRWPRDLLLRSRAVSASSPLFSGHLRGHGRARPSWPRPRWAARRARTHLGQVAAVVGPHGRTSAFFFSDRPQPPSLLASSSSRRAFSSCRTPPPPAKTSARLSRTSQPRPQRGCFGDLPNQDLSTAVEDLGWEPSGEGHSPHRICPLAGFLHIGGNWLMAWVPRPRCQGMSEMGRPGSLGAGGGAGRGGWAGLGSGRAGSRAGGCTGGQGGGRAGRGPPHRQSVLAFPLLLRPDPLLLGSLCSAFLLWPEGTGQPSLALPWTPGHNHQPASAQSCRAALRAILSLRATSSSSSFFRASKWLSMRAWSSMVFVLALLLDVLWGRARHTCPPLELWAACSLSHGVQSGALPAFKRVQAVQALGSVSTPGMDCL